MIRLPQRYSLAVLFLFVLFCAMLPLLAIYFTAHTYNVRLLREEVVSSLQRQNQDFSNRLTDDISRIINTNYMLTQNWELGKLAVVPNEFTDFEKAQTFSSIQDKIFLAQLNSGFIESISVYFPDIDKCLSTNSSFTILSAMRSITAHLDSLPLGQFFIYNGEMVLLSENTFSSDAIQPNMVIQTTLSRRELLTFFKDQYWNGLSQGMVFSLHSKNWPNEIVPGSVEDIFYQQIYAQMDLHDKTRQQNGALQVDIDGRHYQLLYSYIPYAELILLRYFDIAQIDASLGFSQIMLLLFAIVAGLSFALIYYALYRLVNRPLKTLLKGFARVEAGDFDFELDADTRGEFTHVYTGFSQMLARLRVLMQQTYLQGKLVRKSEFKQLQAQIDPHFLYNGFFILNKRIRAGDTDGALAFSKLLSDYFRYVTQNARDIVPLCEEVAHAYNYARIQQIRFANRLALQLDPVPEGYDQVRIPRLILQPIVENVFRHVLDVAEGLTQLHISYHPVDKNVEIWIEDSGTSITQEKLNTMRQALSVLKMRKKSAALLTFICACACIMARNTACPTARVPWAVCWCASAFQSKEVPCLRHILLVDDEPEILEGLALMLKPIPNVYIHTACLASQALQVMQQQPVSLVIADIRMPGMSGIEMWEQIQKISPSCRVIFLSGVRDFDNIYRVIQSPGARFLTKMEPEEKIISTVEEILSEVEDQQQQQLNSQFAKLAAYLMEEKHTHAFLPESACSCALSASKFFAFAFLTPACKWSMSTHERREALQIFFDALYDQCKQAKPHFLSLHDSQAVLLLPIPSPETMENDFLPCLRQVCTLLDGQPRHMYRCAYGALRFSADTLHSHYHNFLHWHALENVPQTFLLPIQELNPPAHAQKLQSEFSHHLRTLQGYAKLGQCEGFLQLTMKMLQSSEQPQDTILWLDHYYSILALLYQQLEAVHDSSLRESIAAEANVPLQDKSAREKAQERLSLYIHQVFAQLFPADPYAHPDMVQSIQRYIRDHLAEDLSLNALSQRFAMHPSYLSRIFRENAGYRLHEYISSLRMSFAAQVLVSSNMRINEIARKAGYDSVHTFIRSFRKQFGCTPAEYRSQNRHTT